MKYRIRSKREIFIMPSLYIPVGEVEVDGKVFERHEKTLKHYEKLGIVEIERISAVKERKTKPAKPEVEKDNDNKGKGK